MEESRGTVTGRWPAAANLPLQDAREVLRSAFLSAAQYKDVTLDQIITNALHEQSIHDKFNNRLRWNRRIYFQYHRNARGR